MTPYEEIDTPRAQRADCVAVGEVLGTLQIRAGLEQAARAAVRPAPSIAFEHFPRDVPKQEIRVDEAAQRLANALHLHLD